MSKNFWPVIYCIIFLGFVLYGGYKLQNFADESVRGRIRTNYPHIPESVLTHVKFSEDVRWNPLMKTLEGVFIKCSNNHSWVLDFRFETKI